MFLLVTSSLFKKQRVHNYRLYLKQVLLILLYYCAYFNTFQEAPSD